MTQTTIGDLLRRHRLEPSFIEKDTLTQKELADLIGCHNSVVSRVERGDQWPTQEYLQRFIEVMHLPPEEAQKIRISYQPNSLSALSSEINQVREDWGEALDVVFHGRQTELGQLQQWILADHCRLVAILGLGGIGKTALATTLAKQLKGEFEFILWRSLRNAPPIADLLAEAIKFFSNQQQTDLPADVSKRITLLLDYFRRQRCLLVLDNLETILRSDRAGYYLEGYEGYGELIQRIGHTEHQSCLLLTSREKPKELTDVYSKTAPTRLLSLGGLTANEGREILVDMGLSGTEEDLDAIIQRYAGSPLALKLVSATVQALYSGDIAAFLKDTTTAVGYIRDPLEQQFERLSVLEREVMYWLAIGREPVSLTELREDIVRLESPQALLEAVEGLHRRSMVETSSGQFTLHPVVLEFVTDQLIQRVCKEILTGQIDLLQSHALMKAQSKEYVRESQVRLILKPVADKLMSSLDQEGLKIKLKHILSSLRQSQSRQPGYAGGNVLNLLCHLTWDLRGYDFSRLIIWQAYLQGVNLPEVNFAYTNLTKSILTGTFDIITSVAFNPSGTLLAAGTANGEIRLWQITDSKQLLTCVGHTDRVSSVTFSSDGSLLASGSNDHTVRLWEVSKGQCLKTLQGHTNQVKSIAFSPDGSLLTSGSVDHTVRLWEVSSGQYLKTLQEQTDEIKSVAFSPDGSLLAIGNIDHTVRLWEVSSGQCLKTLQGHTNQVSSVTFSPDGSLLASGSNDQTVRLWEVSSGHCLKILQGHTNRVRSVAFSPDGSLVASGGIDRTVRLWEVSSGQCLKTLQGHTNQISSVAFSPEGSLLASGGEDHTVRLWEVNNGNCLKTLRGYANRIGSVTFNPDGRLLASGSEDYTVRLWEVGSGRCLETLHGHNDRVRSVTFSPDGRLLASGSEDHTVRLWEVGSGQCLETLRGHTNWVKVVTFSPDGRLLASGSEDHTVRLWEVSSGQCLETLRGHTHRVRSVAFSPEGNLVASGGVDRTIRLWEVSSGRYLKTLPEHTDQVRIVAFSPDGRLLASGSNDHIVRLWEVSSGQCFKTLRGHTNWVRVVAFSPDGNLLASGSEDHTVRLWEVGSGQCLETLHGHTHRIRSIAFSPEGNLVASGSDDETIKFWSIHTGECLKTLRPDRPYERMNITGITGLTEVQKASLKALGAIEIDEA